VTTDKQAPLDPRKVRVVFALVLIFFYWFLMNFNLPYSISSQTVTVELLEKTEYGYLVIGRVQGNWDPVTIRMNFNRYDIDYTLEEDKHYTFIYRTGFLPFKWSIMKIEEYIPRY
jgi:hypothetical protein